VLETGSWVGENILLHRDGTHIPVSQVIVSVLDEQGNPLSLGTIVRDMTAECIAEQERERLRQDAESQAELLRTIIDTVPDAVYVKDLQGRYIVINRSGASVLGLTSKEVIGKTVFDLHAPDLAQQYQETDREIVQSGAALVNEEVKCLDYMDHERWMLSTKVPLYDPGNNIIGVVGVDRDITGEKAVAEEREQLLTTLQRRNVQLRTAAEVSAAASATLSLEVLQQQVVDLLQERFDLYYVGLFLVDQDGKWTGEPGKWLVLRAGTGKPGLAMLTEGHRLAVGGESMVGWCVAHAKARVALNVDREAIRYKNPLLPATRSEMALPLVSLGDAVGALTIQQDRPYAFSEADIAVLQTVANQIANGINNALLYAEVQTYAQELEQRVEARTAQLRQALLMAQESERAKSHFVTTVNHELRTPLANLKLYLGLLRKGRQEKRTHYMETLDREINRLSDLVEDILSIARLEGDQETSKEKVDLAAITREVFNRFTPLAESREIALDFMPPEESICVYADPNQLMRVLINLLGNALTYTQSGGAVALEVETRRAGNTPWAVLSVRDNGPGITPDEQQQIFQRFYRGRAGQESGLPGSGLGLAIVQEIVQLHNGRLELDSEPGAGSTFKVWLPRA
jgi:PAS domain S-box-containing protein